MNEPAVGELPLGRDDALARARGLGGLPRLDEAAREVAADGDEERAGAARHVAHLEPEEVGGWAQAPVFARDALGRALVDERLERVENDFLGERARGVLRAGLPPVRAARHVAAARLDDGRG